MRFESKSVKETLNIGKKIAKNLSAGDIICLFGELGSGKTVLVKGVASGLGIKKEKISSPTFVLIRQHKTENSLAFYHFDLYRLRGCADVASLGYEEFFYGQGISIIEWADRLGQLMPKECLKIKLSVKTETSRLIEFSYLGSRGKKLMEAVREDFGH